MLCNSHVYQVRVSGGFLVLLTEFRTGTMRKGQCRICQKWDGERQNLIGSFPKIGTVAFP
jgi:hypothetical protein